MLFYSLLCSLIESYHDKICITKRTSLWVFSSLLEIPVLFFHLPLRVAVFGVRLQTRWNYIRKIVNTVYEHKDNLITLIDKIIATLL